MIGFVLISEKAMMLNISCDGGTISLIQVYALAANKSDKEIKNFFAVFKYSYNNYEETRYDLSNENEIKCKKRKFFRFIKFKK